MTDELIRSESRLDDEQRGLLAWSGGDTESGDEKLDRIRDHIKLVAASLRLALRREEAARTILAQWLKDCGSIARSAEFGPGLALDTERWLGGSA